MKKIETTLKDAFLLEPAVHGDHRGFFMESYNKQTFQQLGIEIEFVQDNHSLSETPGTLRGMHYQLEPKAQTKIVRVSSGAIYDVIVDIRKGSLTYGKWQGFILSAENKHQLLIPKGFAHGFCTITPNVEVQYKVDELYSPEHDAGIAWDDPALAIEWPMTNVVLSVKDKKHPTLENAPNNFLYGDII
jgi:dTDP-4-dehydrorhamnose 3,5-epimerase